jgi:dihydroflavonol-4-reductase
LPVLPASLLKTAARGLCLWSDLVSHEPPLTTPPDVEFASRYLYFDNTRAREGLGLTFTPVEESLERAVRWFLARGYA